MGWGEMPLHSRDCESPGGCVAWFSHSGLWAVTGDLALELVLTFRKL